MRKPAVNDHPILEPLRERWSPYAFAPTPVSRATLRSLFEAARWAPSSFNEQPWRFVVGTPTDAPEAFAKLVDCLFEGNAVWAKDAPVLALALARTAFTHNEKPNRVAFYDTGQAVGALSVQAGALGLHLHQMGGFSLEKARAHFGIPDNVEPVAMIAIGYLGDPESLPTDDLRARHDNPVRSRRPLAETVLSEWGTRSPLLGDD